MTYAEWCKLYKLDESLIVKRIPKKLLARVKMFYEKYNMSLADSFHEAVRGYSEASQELKKAFYYEDYRAYIPSEYLPESLDFNKYPLYGGN